MVSEQSAVPMIVMTRSQDHVEAVNSALRNAGHPVHCTWLPDARDLADALTQLNPEMLVAFIEELEIDLASIMKIKNASAPGIPVLVARTQVEAFALGTRLTRITRELANRDPDAAIRAAAKRVADWSGGTRLGEAFRTFNDTWGTRGMARGAVVVIISDGWDRGEPEVLAEQMQRLARVAHRVIWVNPLKASPGFAPLAAGMAAALPYVDDFIEGHSLASLADLVAVIGANKTSSEVVKI